VRLSRVDGPRQWLAFPAADSAARVVAAVMARHEVVDIAVREPDIEDVVAELYRGHLLGDHRATGADGGQVTPPAR
jgi:ABC-2 type transport system ATP-binding protein